MVSNICAYPDVAIDPIGPFGNCDGQDDVILMATITGDDGTGTYSWSGPGVSSTVFNPAGLPVGLTTINLSVTLCE